MAVLTLSNSQQQHPLRALSFKYVPDASRRCDAQKTAAHYTNR